MRWPRRFGERGWLVRPQDSNSARAFVPEFGGRRVVPAIHVEAGHKTQVWRSTSAVQRARGEAREDSDYDVAVFLWHLREGDLANR